VRFYLKKVPPVCRLKSLGKLTIHLSSLSAYSSSFSYFSVQDSNQKQFQCLPVSGTILFSQRGASLRPWQNGRHNSFWFAVISDPWRNTEI